MINNLAALHSQYAKKGSHTWWMLKEAKKGYGRAIEGFEKAIGPEDKCYLTALNNHAILMFQEVKMMDGTTRKRHVDVKTTTVNSLEEEGRINCYHFFEVLACS